MFIRTVLPILFLSCGIASAQSGTSANGPLILQAPTTLPISFANSMSADHSHNGDPVVARTVQTVRLANGSVISSGTKVVGHVVAANSFVFDRTPYAKQKESILSIQFDSLQLNGRNVPLNVTVRAVASPIASWDARVPNVNDQDNPSPSSTQIGGDRFSRSQSEGVNMQGDIVAYNRHGGVYAHLISNRGCDASSVEVSVAIFSASACGLYGFSEVSAKEMGSLDKPSTLTLVSTRTSPKIWKNSTALLEVLPERQTVVAQQ
jgi:hypothetical protein